MAAIPRPVAPPDHHVVVEIAILIIYGKVCIIVGLDGHGLVALKD